MHVPQLEEFVLLIEKCQPAPSPIRWRKAALADCAALAFIPFAQQPIHILGRRIDLCQAFLSAIALLRPARARLQPRMFLAPQSGPERVFMVDFDVDRLARVRTNCRLPAAVLVVTLKT